MGKLDIKEVRGAWRDPRREDTEIAPEVRPRPASGEHVRERSAPRTRAPSSPDELMKALRATSPKAAAETAGAPPSTRGPRDLFGLVGTTQAGTFRIESVVAHGGFSVIYKAEHIKFAAPTAIKCLKIPPTLMGEEREDFFLKFKKEGELMFRLSSSCPEVVRPLQLDAFRLPDGQVVPFIALEWLEGQTLKDAIIERLEQGKKPLSLPRAMALLHPVARVLVRAHDFPSKEGRLAILHCDLKPDNIFVAKQDGGEVLKIFDFGIAKVRSAATREAGGATVQSGRNMFTPAYAAPEQWSPDQFGQTGPWTDVFALAITLTELITQRPAIDGSSAAMLTKCMDESKRPSPRTLGLAIDDELEDVFVRALAVDPRERTRSVSEFWGELEDALGMPRTLGAGARLSLPGAVPLTWDDPEPEEDAATQNEALAKLEVPDLDAAESGPEQRRPSMEEEPAAPPSSLTREKAAPSSIAAFEAPAVSTPAVELAPDSLEVAELAPPLAAPVVVPVTAPAKKREPAPQMRFDWLVVALAACAVTVAAKWFAKIDVPVLWICIPILALGALSVVLSKGR